MTDTSTVTRFGTISTLWQKNKSLWQFFEGFFRSWQKFVPTWLFLNPNLAKFIVANEQILKQWSSPSVTLDTSHSLTHLTHTFPLSLSSHLSLVSIFSPSQYFGVWFVHHPRWWWEPLRANHVVLFLHQLDAKQSNLFFSCCLHYKQFHVPVVENFNAGASFSVLCC